MYRVSLVKPYCLGNSDQPPLLDSYRLTDRVGLSPRQLPEGPVILEELGLVAGPVGPGDTLLARVAADDRGWRAVVGLGLPGRPSDALVARWVSWVVLERRLSAPTTPLGVALRRWGHELCRYAHEWAWLRYSSSASTVMDTSASSDQSSPMSSTRA